jgi:ribosomal protein S18 acetylase RimI-like enzyme
MQIREIQFGDKEEFIKIMKESGYVDGYSDESIERFVEKDQNIVYIGAFVEGEIVGIVSLTFGNSSYKLSPFAWCDDVYVKNSHRKMGIGRQLLKKAEEISRAKNCSNILLGVGEDEQEAIAFYRKVGFKDMKCRLMTLSF